MKNKNTDIDTELMEADFETAVNDAWKETMAFNPSIDPKQLFRDAFSHGIEFAIYSLAKNLDVVVGDVNPSTKKKNK